MTSNHLLKRAEQFLEAASASAEAGRLDVAYEEARTALELGVKAALLQKTGSFPKVHNPVREMVAHSVLPSGISAKKVSRLLGDASRGAYGFAEPVDPGEVKVAIQLAQQVLKAAYST